METQNLPGSHGVLGESSPALPRAAEAPRLSSQSIFATFGIQKAKPSQNKLFSRGFYKTRTRALVVLIPILNQDWRFWGGWNPTQGFGQFVFQLKSPCKHCSVQHEPWKSVPLHSSYRKKKYCEASPLVRKINISHSCVYSP